MAFLETLLRGGGRLNSQHVLRLNVGFLLNKNTGYSRNFEFFEPAVQLGDDLDVTDLHGAIQLTRIGEGLYAQGRLDASTTLDCVRCLLPYLQNLKLELSDLFAFPPKRASESLLSIPESGILDLNPIVREYFLLDIPIQPLCRKDCKGLCPVCGGNLNESDCNHTQDEIDPRLEALRALIDKS
jgi:uncharacterized protein